MNKVRELIVNRCRCFDLLVTTVLLLVIISVPVLAVDAKPSDGKAILPEVIEALKKIDNPSSGKGVAFKKIDFNGVIEEEQLNFIFKGSMSRTDIYTASESGKHDGKGSGWIKGPKSSVAYNDKQAFIKSSAPLEFDRVVGRDFHPEAFLHNDCHNKAMWEVLNALNNNSDCDIRTMWKGDILEIHVSYESDKASIYYDFSLDVKKDFRPVYYMQSRDVTGQPDESSIYSCQYEWKQFGTEWYIIDTLEHLKGTGQILNVETGESKMKAIDKKTEVTIQEFTPNVHIEDNEFTLAALNLSPDILVIDKIAGLEYYMGSGMPNTDQLDDILINAEFPKKVESDIDSKCIIDVQKENIVNQNKYLPDESNSQNKTHISKIYLLFTITTIIALIVLTIIVIRFKRAN